MHDKGCDGRGGAWQPLQPQKVRITVQNSPVTSHHRASCAEGQGKPGLQALWGTEQAQVLDIPYLWRWLPTPHPGVREAWLQRR